MGSLKIKNVLGQWELLPIIKGDKGDTGETGIQGPKGDQGDQGPKGDKGDKGDTGASIVSAGFVSDDIVFTKDDTNTVVLADAAVTLKGDQGPQGIQGAQGIPGEVQLSDLTATNVGLGNVDNVKQMPISGGVLENYREKLITLTGTNTTIDLSLGNVFTHTLTGNTTYTISNAVSGQAHSFTLIINQPATVSTLTFPASVKWQGGEVPDLSNTSKTYVLTFMTVDGGTTWLGMFGGEF